MATYKNIIFDLGGVVVDYTPKDFLMDRFMNRKAEQIVYTLTFGSKEWEDLDRGVIARGTANRIMLENAAACGRTFEVQAVIDEWESFLHTKQSTVNTINADPAAANNQLELRVTFVGDVASAAVICNGQDVKVNAGGEVNTKTGAVTAIGGQTSGSTTTNPIKATGASMNMTAAVVAALAMAATMGSAVVYSAKKGLLAK